MNPVVFNALLPVVALILPGLIVGRARWLGPAAVRTLSSLAFMLLTPVVLFRAMSRVRVEQLDLTPALVYTLTLALVFGVSLRRQGLTQRATVLALAVTYANAVMIGIPLISLVWGDEGLVTLFTLVPIHSLLLLTSATVLLEFVRAREPQGRSQGQQPRSAQHGGLASAAFAPARPGHEGSAAHPAGQAQLPAPPPPVAARLWAVGLQALRKALVHPVPLPILAGLLFAQTGWEIPRAIDLPMAWIGKAFGPLALFLVGVSLAATSIGSHLRTALWLTVIKNLLVPALAGALGWAFGMRGVALAVLMTTAALPAGANAFMFAQRYGVAQEVVTATVGVSTALAAVTVSLLLLLVGPVA